MNNKILISDLHFGEKNNSNHHNEQLLKFFQFLIDWKTNTNTEFELVIMGDVFHQRDKLAVDTINYAISGMELLAASFDKVTMLVGNHDMYYRDHRDVHSLKMFQHIPNITIIDRYKIEDECMYVSWVITAEEYAEIVELSKKHNIKAIYSHFEFSGFQLNDNYTMTHGQTHRELQHVENVFSGHYHKRQVKDNVVYIGTPFPYDFNDANDSERGFCVHTPNGYAFIDYEKIKVLSVSHEEFLAGTYKDTVDTTIRVVIDATIDQDTMDQIKDKMEAIDFRDSRVQYKIDKNAQMTPDKFVDVEDGDVDDIDAFVLRMIDEMDEGQYDKDLLKSIYIKAKGK